MDSNNNEKNKKNSASKLAANLAVHKLVNKKAVVAKAILKKIMIAKLPLIAGIAGIILLLIIIAGAITYLIPNSILSLFTQVYETRDTNPAFIDTEMLYEESYHDTPHWFQTVSDFLSGNRKLGYNTDESSSTETLTYNFDDEYTDVTLDNRKLVRKAFKKAYKMAKKEAKAYCKANGYNWRKCKASLKDTNSDSWEKVYESTNYGDIITALNMGYSKKNNFETDFNDYDQDAFKKSLLNPANMSYYYEIYYKNPEDYDPTEGGTIADSDIELTESQQAEYDNALVAYQNAVNSGDQEAVCPTRAQFASKKKCTITIKPYTLTTLYQMIGVDPTAEFENNLTYEEWRQEQMTTLKEVTANISTEMGYRFTTPYTYDNGGGTVSSVISQFTVVDGDVAMTVWNALRAQGYNRATASGIMGNICQESHFNIGAVSSDGNDSYGICQWTFDRKSRLLARNDGTTAEGQATFLLLEIEGRMGSQYSNLINVNEDEAGTLEACDWFAYIFESPANVASEEEWRSNPKYSKYTWSRFLPCSEYTGRYLLDAGNRRGYALGYFNDPITYP